MGSSKSKETPAGEDKPVKIDKWDTSALKNALDDAAKKVLLEDDRCVESHSLMDGRLMICTLAVGFAMFALVWDYLRPFPESRPILIICVLSYYVLMAVLMVYTSYREAGVFLVALEKDKTCMDPDNVWSLASSLRKYDDTYHLVMTFKDGKTKESRTQKTEKSVASFFDENGTLCYDLYKPLVEKMRAALSKDKKEN